MNSSPKKDIPLFRISTGILFLLAFGAICYSVMNVTEMVRFIGNPEFSTVEDLFILSAIAILLGIGGPIGFVNAVYGAIAFKCRFAFEKSNRCLIAGLVIIAIQIATLIFLLLFVYQSRSRLLALGVEFYQVLLISIAPFLVGIGILCLIVYGALQMKREYIESRQQH
ncbi:MAG: hypothetical protein RR009_04135 [Oscillospiraceae bacterium]